MSKTLTFELPDELWAVFQEMAPKTGKSAELLALEWLAKHAPKKPQLTAEEAEEARQRFRRHFGSVHSGNPRSSDNEQIDADLMREYENTHEEES